MALENIGIGGLLTFNGEQAISGMGAATAATNQLNQSQTGLVATMSSVSSGLNQFASVTGKAALALAPLTGILGVGLDKAAKFEQQMSAVRAVSMGTDEEMAKLTLTAKHLGVETVFSATQVGSAMEELSRAGATTQEILSGIGGVLDAASADSIDLATSASIVSNVVRGMGLTFSDATHVADVLALASAKTNTDMIGLGESFKYASATARNMKIPLETTAALLGAAADSGLKGSIGGTSFAAMLNKLAAPSKKATAFLKANNFEMKTTATGALDVVAVLTDLNKIFEGMPSVVEKAAMAHEVFGDRGAKAFNAISASIQQNRLPDLINALEHADGAAKKMAAARLDNFLGQVTLLKSTLEALAIETVGQFLGPMAGGVKAFTGQLNNVVFVLQDLNGAVKTNREELESKYGPVAVAVAYGISEGIHTVIDAWKFLRATVIDFITTVTGSSSPQLIQSIAKWATILVFVGGALAPILGGLSAIAFFTSGVVIPLISSLGTMIGGLGEVAMGVANVWTLVFGAALLAMHNEGESFGALMTRVWTTGSMLVTWFRDNAVLPLVTVFNTVVVPAIESVKQTTYNFVVAAGGWFQQLFGAIILAVQRLAPVFSAVFQGLATVVRVFVKAAATLFGWLLEAIQPVFSAIKEVGLWIIENIVNAFQKVVKVAVKAADMLGVSSGSKMWADLALFADQPTFKVTDTAGKLASIDAAQNLGKPSAAPPEAPMTEYDMALAAAEGRAKQKGAAMKQPVVNVGVDLKDERQLQIDNCLTVNGRNMAVAMAQHKQEINERAGFRATPWQRRQIAEQGAAPVGGLGGGM